ncbi:MAG: hypothetical protein V3S51_09240 [Dehalococcoidia bacterium]
MANKDNPRKGRDFEKDAHRLFESQGIRLQRNFTVDIGVATVRRPHKFDLGAIQPPLLVECKSHTWTGGGNAPAAKLSVWNEAMLYFLAAPADYRKILFVLESVRNGESLAHYYVRRYGHLIPEGVEIWEFSAETSTASEVPTK